MKSSKNITMPRPWHAQRAIFALALAYSATLIGCHPDMWNQPRFTALQKNEFFTDNAADRLPVADTVPYAGIRRPWTAPVFESITGEPTVPSSLEDVFWNGKLADGTFQPDNYFEVNMGLLERGRERYMAICSHCHGEGGYGNGLVVQRGFPAPISYHVDRLREVEDGYIVDVITNGFGRMYSYAARVSAEDRWAIAAYIRALQYSQNVPDAELTDADREAIEKAQHPEAEAEHDTADTHNAH